MLGEGPPSAPELEALRAVCEHRTIQAAADAIRVARSTLNGRLGEMRQRYGVHSTIELAELARVRGWR